MEIKEVNRISPSVITELNENEVFVFGSNIQGMHGGGAARTALKWGARIGKGIGLHGSTYAIPTMFSKVEEIKPYVEEFIQFVQQHCNLKFLVTEIGCGIAGFTPNDIAPLFADTSHIENIYLPESFWMVINHPEDEYPLSFPEEPYYCLYGPDPNIYSEDDYIADLLKPNEDDK